MIMVAPQRERVRLIVLFKIQYSLDYSFFPLLRIVIVQLSISLDKSIVCVCASTVGVLFSANR